MNATTLRGVFPDPKPVYKRNFIKENVKHIKQMQGILQNSGLFEARPTRLQTVSQHNPPPQRSRQTLVQSRSLPVPKLQRIGKKKAAESDKAKGDLRQSKLRLAIPEESIEKHTHRGVQTDTPEDINKMYENGIIKYPSPGVLQAMASKRSPRRRDRGTQQGRSLQQDCGDTGGIIVPNPHNQELSDNMQTLDISEKHNFIKGNIMALRQKALKQDNNDSVKTQTYQKGVLPKYLRDRKEEERKELQGDADCPEGHVLLPEEERKETLRVLRQSYADRIQELNSMPVRNDTLRMRKRKMAIEEELKKIDEGIKVFQRPKVFVKINA